MASAGSMCVCVGVGWSVKRYRDVGGMWGIGVCMGYILYIEGEGGGA